MNTGRVRGWSRGCDRGDRTPKTHESNFIHNNFLQFGKQHSRYKAMLFSITLPQQCCEVYFIPLTVAKPLWDLTSKYYWNRPAPNLTGWIRTWVGWISKVCSPRSQKVQILGEFRT